jgi:hypothetical protein
MAKHVHFNLLLQDNSKIAIAAFLYANPVNFRVNN